MELMLQSQSFGDRIVIVCDGRIVYQEEPIGLTQAVEHALERGREIILDLAAVESIDSAGLGELVVIRMLVESRGKTLKLAAPGERVMDVLDLTRLSSIFDIFPSTDAALAVEDECAEAN